MAGIQTLFRSELAHIYNFRCEGVSTRPRREEASPEHAIVFPRQGVFVRRDSGGAAVADVCHALFFNRGQPYEVDHPAAGGDSCTVFGFEPVVLEPMLMELDPAIAERPGRPFPASHCPITSDLRAGRLPYFLTRDRTERSPALEVEERILDLVSEIFTASRRFLDRPRSVRRSLTRADHGEIVNRVKLFLWANLGEDLSIPRIARRVFCSPFHMCRIFRQRTGFSIHRYLQRLRLFVALERLGSGSESLTALALDLGYSSHSHFTTAFRNEFGLPPSRFRSSHTRGEFLLK